MSDSYNEHLLLYARRIDEEEEIDNDGGLSPLDNPQEASSTTLNNTSATNSANSNNLLQNNEKTVTQETFIKQYLSRIITAIIALLLIGLVFVLLPYYAVHAAKNDKWNETLYWTAGVFVLIAVPVSVHGIIQHLVNVSLLLLIMFVDIWIIYPDRLALFYSPLLIPNLVLHASSTKSEYLNSYSSSSLI